MWWIVSSVTIPNVDVVIDMFANHIEMNDGYEVTQDDIDKQFVIPVPKQTARSKLIPIVMLSVKYVNGVPTSRPFTALVDSGSTGCLYNRRALPYGAQTSTSPN